MKTFYLVIVSVAELLLSGFSLSHKVLENACEDWEAYSDQKCFKIFDEPGLVNYEDAENFCKIEHEAHLLTIGIEEEQNFIQAFLKSKEITDNVWIGLKYVDNSYQWVDDTPLHYTNWATGSPKNEADHCVQIETDETTFGEWSDVLCTKKNLIICEKIQLWSSIELQTVIMNLIKNPVPIGFIYVQLPKEKAPGDIWSWMEWKDVSSDYAGVFFRVEGGDSDSFGSVQQPDSPRLTHITRKWDDFTTNHEDFDLKPGMVNGPIDFEVSEYHNARVYFTVSNPETRPLNMAIRVWKRIL